jgi:hypothetical protein
MDDPVASTHMSALGNAGLYPVIHHDKDTGSFKMTVHDMKTNKQIGTISQSGDFHFPQQKMNPAHYEALKNHASGISDHFNSYVESINGGEFGKKEVKKSDSYDDMIKSVVAKRRAERGGSTSDDTGTSDPRKQISDDQLSMIREKIASRGRG